MFEMTVQNNQGGEKRKKAKRRHGCEERRNAGEEEVERETRTSTTCSRREMTPGHPEASGLSGCLGKPRTHLMTPAWSVSHRFFLSGLRMGNDNGLVNYCASRLRAHIRQGVLHDEKSEGEVRWRFKGTQKLG